jgi:cell wall-associated NlpC family hydrolase
MSMSPALSRPQSSPSIAGRFWLTVAVAAIVAALAGCATHPREPATPREYLVVGDRDKGREVVMYAFSLIDIGYRFGGNNPDTGLDCSGMVSYLYDKVTGARLPHNAAAIARMARPIDRSDLQPGDLLFFNTRRKPFSHVAIFVGNDRFVHAPSSNGKIRLDSLSEGYFAKRFESARTLFRN